MRDGARKETKKSRIFLHVDRLVIEIIRPQNRNDMPTTYYLLRSKDAAVGDGSYLGTDAEGSAAMVTTSLKARRFVTLDAAEHTAAEVGEQFAGFEIEVRNSDD
jgi:hypothetical protein